MLKHILEPPTKMQLLTCRLITLTNGFMNFLMPRENATYISNQLNFSNNLNLAADGNCNGPSHTHLKSSKTGMSTYEYIFVKIFIFYLVALSLLINQEKLRF